MSSKSEGERRRQTLADVLSPEVFGPLRMKLEPWFTDRDKDGAGIADTDVGQIDSTENVGLPWGVQSVEPGGAFEVENAMLLADGVGGSKWGFGTPSLSSVVLAEPCVTAFWKFNETSGDIAEDSFNGYDAVSGAGDPPTWAAALSPFNENAAQFGTGLIEQSTAFPAMTGDLTVEIWAKRLTSGSGSGVLWTQGDGASSNSPGAAVYWLNSSASNLIVGYVGDSTGGPHLAYGLTNYSTSAWHHIVLRRASHIWTLFVDAVAAVTTYDDSGTNYNTATGIEFGNKQSALTADFFPGYLSYAAAYNCALSDADIALHYSLGVSPSAAPAGWVWTSDGTSAYWAPATVEVEFS